jgi:hypothetical protein
MELSPKFDKLPLKAVYTGKLSPGRFIYCTVSGRFNSPHKKGIKQ